MREIRWDDIFGHEWQKSRLQKIIDNGLPHCLLFVGRDSIGKKLMAERLAEFFWCEKQLSPCGECRDCRLGWKNQSLLLNSDSKQPINIEEIRLLKDRLSRTDFAAKTRVVVVDRVQSLTKVAANSLLKLLEEPQNNIVFILLTDDAARVLPTIKSRCIAVYFDKLSADDMVKLLVNWGEDTENSIWQPLTKTGQAVWLKKMWRQDMEEMQGKVVSFWKILSADYWVKAEVVKKICELDKEKIYGVLSFWEMCLRHFLLWRQGQEKNGWWSNEKLLVWYKQTNFSWEKIVFLLDKLSDLKTTLTNNTHKKTQIFNFLLQF